MAAEQSQSGSARAKQYAKSDDASITKAKHQIAHLLENVDDRGGALSSKALADRVGLKPTTVRDLIPEIRSEYDMPIVACNNGYYQIQSVSQLELELERIEDEIKTREKRKQELCQAFNRGGE